MGAAVDIFAKIRDLVPGREVTVERLYWSDADFRALCNDYRTCHETLQRLRCLNCSDALRRRSEYAELLEELAVEIRNWQGDCARKEGSP